MRSSAFKLSLFILLLGCNFVLNAQDHNLTVLSPVAVLEPTEFFSSITWCPDGSCLATIDNYRVEAAYQQMISIFDTTTGKRIDILDTDPFLATNRVLQFTPDGKYLIAFDEDFALWEFQSRSLLLTIEDCTSLFTNISHDGTKLLVNCYQLEGHRSQTGQIWDIASGTKLLSLPGYINWLFDNQYLIHYQEATPYLYILDAETGTEIDRLSAGADIVAVMVSETTNQMLVFSDVITLWDMNNQKKLASFPYDGERFWLTHWHEQVEKLTYFDDAGAVAWDIHTGQPLSEIIFPDGFDSYGGEGWNDDLRLFMSDFRNPAGCEENCSYGTYVWNGASSELITQSSVTAQLPYSIWRPGYAQIISQVDEQNFVIWDVRTGETLYRLAYPPEDNIPDNASFEAFPGPDGSRLLTTGKSDRLYIWNIPSDR